MNRGSPFDEAAGKERGYARSTTLVVYSEVLELTFAEKSAMARGRSGGVSSSELLLSVGKTASPAVVVRTEICSNGAANDPRENSGSAVCAVS